MRAFLVFQKPIQKIITKHLCYIKDTSATVIITAAYWLSKTTL